MDMSGMSMSMGSSGMFTGVNKAIAQGFWYAIVGFVGLLVVGRCIAWSQSRRRLALHRQGSRPTPSKPQGLLAGSYATLTAILREMTYPQPLHFSGSISKYFTPPPLGRCLLLAAYWTMLLTMLWSNVLLSPNDPMYAYKWEKVGFRAAWVSVTQIPFIYLLSAKFNPISLLTGVSYERFNWLHRWAARTVFLTVIVHWSFFFREWWLADFVDLQLKMMPMVKYGFGAWAVIGWLVLTGFGFFRAKCYELFVAQHIVAAAVLIWLLHKHVPAYAQYNIWLSVAFVAFDWGARILWGVARNSHLLSRSPLKLPGYSATTEVLPGDMVRLTLHDVDFSWRAGQHAHLHIPSIRLLEVHPFTIANACQPDTTGNLTFLIKAHTGFSHSLLQTARKDGPTCRSRRVFLTGPWGNPPALSHYDTVILIACASGASFVVPLLSVLARHRGCVRRLHAHWIVREREHLAWFERDFQQAVQCSRQMGTHLQIAVHVTRHDGAGAENALPAATASDDKVGGAADPVLVEISSASISPSTSTPASGSTSSATSFSLPEKHPLASERPALLLQTSLTRPSIDSLIRPPVEAALGETAIVSCGPAGFTAEIRTLVARLSDERAVHKGSGALGIGLFTETYGW